MNLSSESLIKGETGPIRNVVAEFYDHKAEERGGQAEYDALLKRYYASYIPAGKTVLEAGCGQGDLLAHLRPSRGIGLDVSERMVQSAKARHPHHCFYHADACRPGLDQRFDYIIASDLINELPDVQELFRGFKTVSDCRSRLIVNFVNNLWRPVLSVARRMGAASPRLPQNWLSKTDVAGLLYLEGWEIIRHDRRILFPFRFPILSGFFNRWVAPLVPPLCLVDFIVARLQAERPSARQFSCSIIIPARNEAGNISEVVRRTPDLGTSTELVFIEGGSRDGTWREIQKVIQNHPERHIRALRQKSTGKGGAVREAFVEAQGEALFILDADLTTPPEDLPKFYEALRSGAGEFVNGVRLVYPMESEAMRFSNMIGNKSFGWLLSWLLGQPVKDTLCGTKAMFQTDYEELVRSRFNEGREDPFGDFDLLFAAARLNLKIVDIPVRYKARTYGQTNIRRWRDGWQLLRLFAATSSRMKFL